MLQKGESPDLGMLSFGFLYMCSLIGNQTVLMCKVSLLLEKNTRVKDPGNEIMDDLVL